MHGLSMAFIAFSESPVCLQYNDRLDDCSKRLLGYFLSYTSATVRVGRRSCSLRLDHGAF